MSRVTQSRKRRHPGSQPRRLPRPQPASGRRRERESGPPPPYGTAVATRQHAGMARRLVSTEWPVLAPARETSQPRLPRTSRKPGRPLRRYRSGGRLRRNPVTARAAERCPTSPASQVDRKTSGRALRRTAGHPPSRCPHPRREPTTACRRRLRRSSRRPWRHSYGHRARLPGQTGKSEHRGHVGLGLGVRRDPAIALDRR